MCIEDSLAFLHTLFKHIPTPDQHYLTLTALHPDGRPAPSRHLRLDSPDLPDAVARLHAMAPHGYGGFFGIATRTSDLGRWQRGGRADLGLLPALYADIDRPLEQTLKRLEDFSPPPTYTVSSGCGAHLYWMLQYPTHDLKQAEPILHGLGKALGGDKLTVAQSMRLPGTLNTKPGRDNASCRILSHEPHRLYFLDDFERFLPALVAKQSVPQRRTRWPYLDDLKRLIADILRRDFGGYQKPNGWIAARCPCGHSRDAPGMHFGYHPEYGVGRCFGKHGRLLVKDLCQVMRVGGR